jgi:hypothetical protein
MVKLLKSNIKLLEKISSRFRDLIKQISMKNIQANLPSTNAINFAMKKAARIVNSNNHIYLINLAVQGELLFIKNALKPDSGIKFKTPIAHLIPRILTASIVGDSSLIACGKYSITLKFWWHLSLQEDVVKRTLLHLKGDLDKTFISTNCLEYVTIIVNYCASLVVLKTQKINDDLYPVVLCVMDNRSVLNWTLHISTKSKISRALARFFCGLLIGSNHGFDTKWISTVKNKILDKISRLKKLTMTNSISPSSHHT